MNTKTKHNSFVYKIKKSNNFINLQNIFNLSCYTCWQTCQNHWFLGVLINGMNLFVFFFFQKFHLSGTQKTKKAIYQAVCCDLHFIGLDLSSVSNEQLIYTIVIYLTVVISSTFIHKCHTHWFHLSHFQFLCLLIATSKTWSSKFIIKIPLTRKFRSGFWKKTDTLCRDQLDIRWLLLLKQKPLDKSSSSLISRSEEQRQLFRRVMSSSDKVW